MQLFDKLDGYAPANAASHHHPLIKAMLEANDRDEKKRCPVSTWTTP
jgi:hypothetical protein